MERDDKNSPSKQQGVVVAMVRAMRPHQWVKNLFVLAPLVFASADKTASQSPLGDLVVTVLYAMGAALLFCLVSGAVYLLNDTCDVAADRAHPEKCTRPIASGLISVRQALATLSVLVLIGVVGGAAVYGYAFALVIGTYFLSNTAYSMLLKNYAYVDITFISLGFILRVLSGALAIQAPVSNWLLLCTFLLAFFLALGKRLHEVLALTGAEGKTRKSLKGYSSGALRNWMRLSGALTCAAFFLYTLDPGTASKFGHQNLAYTVPCIVFGLYRFYFLVHDTGSYRSPTERMIRDKPFILNLLVWGAAVVVVLFW